MKVKDLLTCIFTATPSLSTSNTYKQMVSVVRFHVYESIQINVKYLPYRIPKAGFPKQLNPVSCGHYFSLPLMCGVRVAAYKELPKPEPITPRHSALCFRYSGEHCSGFKCNLKLRKLQYIIGTSF